MDIASLLDLLFRSGQILALALLAAGVWLIVVHKAKGKRSEDESDRRRNNPGDWEL